MDPPSTLQCNLRPYQKQALYWMSQLEKGNCMDEAGTTLHPCWEAYNLADKYVGFCSQYILLYTVMDINEASVLNRRKLVVYLNMFSGDATTEFPSTLQMARGGVCPYTFYFYWKLNALLFFCAVS